MISREVIDSKLDPRPVPGARRAASSSRASAATRYVELAPLAAPDPAAAGLRPAPHRARLRDRPRAASAGPDAALDRIRGAARPMPTSRACSTGDRARLDRGQPGLRGDAIRTGHLLFGCSTRPSCGALLRDISGEFRSSRPSARRELRGMTSPARPRTTGAQRGPPSGCGGRGAATPRRAAGTKALDQFTHQPHRAGARRARSTRSSAATPRSARSSTS